MFLCRFGAALIDLLAIAIATIVMVLVVGAVLAVSGAEPDGSLARLLPPTVALIVFVGYFAVLETRGALNAPNRGTLGKAAFKLAVEDINGDRLRPGQAVLRQLAKLATFPLALFMLHARAPHDWVAGSKVVRKLAISQPQ